MNKSASKINATCSACSANRFKLMESKAADDVRSAVCDSEESH